MPALDEAEIAAQLRGLSAAQPPQPVDRLPAVRARASGIRRRQALAAGAAAVLVAGVPAGLLATRDSAPAPVVPATTPISAWPDRSLPDDQGVAQGALRTWRKYAEGRPSTPEIRWLFRGEVAAQSGRSTYVAVFVAGAYGRGQQLVTATADRDQVDDRGLDARDAEPGSSPWKWEAVPFHDTATHVGLYLRGQQTPDNSLFVLADPAARELSWTAQPLPFAPPADTSRTQRRGTASSPDGVFVEDAGPLDGPVQVQISGPALPVQTEQPLTTTDLPMLVEAAPLVLPPGQEHHVGVSGQTEWEEQEYRPDGSVLEAGFRDRFRLTDDTGSDPARSWAVQAVCYGGGRMRVAVMGQRGTVRCDGQQRSPFGVFQQPEPGGFVLRLEGDGVHVYRLAVATVE